MRIGVLAARSQGNNPTRTHTGRRPSGPGAFRMEGGPSSSAAVRCGGGDGGTRSLGLWPLFQNGKGALGRCVATKGEAVGPTHHGEHKVAFALVHACHDRG
jgi:hypothetical protein